MSNNVFNRREHHGNALFRAARSLSPGTTNFIAMRQLRKDWTAFSREKADIFIKEQDICRDERDEHEAEFRYDFTSTYTKILPSNKLC